MRHLLTAPECTRQGAAPGQCPYAGHWLVGCTVGCPLLIAALWQGSPLHISSFAGVLTRCRDAGGSFSLPSAAAASLQSCAPSPARLNLHWVVQEENEEMGRELGEGKVHGLERQLALAKSFAEDMRRAHAELEDHCTTLDEEAEKLQDEVGSPKEAEAAAG